MYTVIQLQKVNKIQQNTNFEVEVGQKKRNVLPYQIEISIYKKK